MLGDICLWPFWSRLSLRLKRRSSPAVPKPRWRPGRRVLLLMNQSFCTGRRLCERGRTDGRGCGAQLGAGLSRDSRAQSQAP
ncbi:hypothetical protein KIL84_003133 [Mauremys mutica]|uniref:Uncharacterized protein n=1 Tax=Mauremys mutica TaxID=74926 RepID=A0A9D3WVJ5_9SAUR|nr:hypothetical protein KIL84_003133 [Mauremys mutica]